MTDFPSFPTLIDGWRKRAADLSDESLRTVILECAEEIENCRDRIVKHLEYLGFEVRHGPNITETAVGLHTVKRLLGEAK